MTRIRSSEDLDDHVDYLQGSSVTRTVRWAQTQVCWCEAGTRIAVNA